MNFINTLAENAKKNIDDAVQVIGGDVTKSEPATVDSFYNYEKSCDQKRRYRHAYWYPWYYPTYSYPYYVPYYSAYPSNRVQIEREPREIDIDIGLQIPMVLIVVVLALVLMTLLKM